MLPGPAEVHAAMLGAGGALEGLAPGATSEPVSLRSELGYTGSDQSRQEMLQNTHFADAKVSLTAKYSNIQWVRMGEFPIERKLLTK